MSYSELNRQGGHLSLRGCQRALNERVQANDLAVTLRHHHNIQINNMVPIFVDQTPNLLIAVIGISRQEPATLRFPEMAAGPHKQLPRFLTDVEHGL